MKKVLLTALIASLFSINHAWALNFSPPAGLLKDQGSFYNCGSLRYRGDDGSSGVSLSSFSVRLLGGQAILKKDTVYPDAGKVSEYIQGVLVQRNINLRKFTAGNYDILVVTGFTGVPSVRVSDAANPEWSARCVKVKK